MAEVKDLIEHVMKFRTEDVDEFIKVNTFYCIRYNVTITPEDCFQRRVISYLSEDVFWCRSCRNDIMSDFKDVIKKRLDKRGISINEVELERVLDVYLDWIGESVARKQSIDRNVIKEVIFPKRAKKE